MNDTFNELVETVKKRCANNINTARRQLAFLKTIKKKDFITTVAMNNYLSHSDTVRAWEIGIREYELSLNKYI